MIYLYNDSKPFTAKWDGVEYELCDTPVEVDRGIAEHWMQRFPDAQLRVEEIPRDVIDRRMPINPLEANDRGEAFAGIKRTRKRASGE